jgi:transposase
MRFLGIDISKRKFHAALLLDGKVESRSPDNNQAGIESFITWLSKRAGGPVHACMEATGTYWEDLARALVAAGHTVSVENPKLIHNFAKALNMRSKTDAVDALLIARYAEKMRPPAWQPPPCEYYELRQLMRRREELVKMLTQELNRLQAGCLHPLEQRSLERHIAYLKAEIADSEKLLRSHTRSHEDLAEQKKLLQSIPGIGEVTSWTLLARLRPPEAYASAKQVAAFVGVTPKERSSGTSVRGKARMCKMGDPEVRRVLYLAAMAARKHDSAARAFGERLEKAGKANMEVLGALMRKLLHIAYGVLKHKTPYNPALAYQAA